MSSACLRPVSIFLWPVSLCLSHALSALSHSLSASLTHSLTCLTVYLPVSLCLGLSHCFSDLSHSLFDLSHSPFACLTVSLTCFTLFDLSFSHLSQSSFACLTLLLNIPFDICLTLSFHYLSPYKKNCLISPSLSLSLKQKIPGGDGAVILPVLIEKKKKWRLEDEKSNRSSRFSLVTLTQLNGCCPCVLQALGEDDGRDREMEISCFLSLKITPVPYASASCWGLVPIIIITTLHSAPCRKRFPR